MENGREHMQADFLRHGMIDRLSAVIEANQKPDYNTAVDFIEGRIDPPIDVEASRQILQEKLEKDEITTQGINVIIHSQALRGTQTAELLRDVAQMNAQLRPTDLLREVNPPMSGVTREMYEAAPDWQAVRQMFMKDFLDGAKGNEDLVGAYRRAERFLVYLRRIRTQTKANPTFISHGMFSRFITLAMQHDGEDFNDDQVRELVRA
ncbi:MAG: histidine phosphatase family protein, partial [Patescibacteria group bacterium]